MFRHYSSLPPDEQILVPEDAPSCLEDAVDYVQCEKCRKKILVWEFPEHEDFHYAQELSKQICMPGPALATSNGANVLASKSSESSSNNKKRKGDAVATREMDGDGNKSKNPKTKQRKVESATVKSIDSFFRKN